ncbi:hypothetical protein Cgig2_006190 [Carnegiea gigantea]|uniref:Pentatricopeptide repeat-containing protein n=1 Tax=Carnegiea gigantea TaxID=171969 RepID=A0A9Q1QU51_9CARY|nr:hypothetical protein Cgig2_006190 [Carnegiea gigantea]
MLKTLSFSFPSLPSSKPHPFPNSAANPFPQKNLPFLSNPHSLSSEFKLRAKRKGLMLGRPLHNIEKGKYGYEVETLIDRLSSLPPRASIARFLEPFKNKLTLNDFALVFKEFAQRGDWQRSLRLFKYIQRQIWCKPNENIYNIIIGVLGREGLLEKAHEVFDQMPIHNVPRTVFSYTALIHAYGRNGKYETALELLNKMKRERVAPNILTYNSVINSCARGGLAWEELLGLFAEIRHEGIQPDIITYNTLLSACASRGLGDEAEMVFRTMNESGILPDVTTYNYVVETFRKLGNLGKVSDLLKEMELSGNLPDISSYNVLLEAYAKQGSIKDAMGVFRQMQEAGCMPNALTYSILLNLYGSQGRYDDVRELFLDMKVSNTKPDAATYNILIQVFGAGGYFKEVVTLFRDMAEENVEPNMETYEGLIFACGKGGLYQDAKEILLHMNGKGLVPSPKAYTGVIEAYGQAALYEEAIVAFNTMNEVGSRPTVETYNSLIHTFARGGLYKEIDAILTRMDEAGVPWNKDSFDGVIEGFRQAGQFEDAVKAYIGMDNAVCDPDEQTLEAVLSVYCFAALVDVAEEQFEEMKALGILPSVMCYCMMVAMYAKTDRVLTWVRLLWWTPACSVADGEASTGSLVAGNLPRRSGVTSIATAGSLYRSRSGRLKCSRARFVRFSFSVVAGRGFYLVDRGKQRVITELGMRASRSVSTQVCFRCNSFGNRRNRLIDAYKLLSEMLNNRTSSIHQVIAQMIKGDLDDESNWQMIEYVFDKLNSEGCAFRTRFYNTLLEALWWLGQKERAARVLKEATKRGLFPELFRKSKLVWSLDVHRLRPDRDEFSAVLFWNGKAFAVVAMMIVEHGF